VTAGKMPALRTYMSLHFAIFTKNEAGGRAERRSALSNIRLNGRVLTSGSAA
jgi:hypothetical protein